MLDPGTSPEEGEDRKQDRKHTKHAPDLLEGPNINEEGLYLVLRSAGIHTHTQHYAVPDVSLTGLDYSSHSFKSLLSALGLSKKRPTPQRFKLGVPDPMGEGLFKASKAGIVDSEEGGSSGGGTQQQQSSRGDNAKVVKMSLSCDGLMGQVQKLKSVEESLMALERVTGSAQTLVARQVTMMVIGSVYTNTSKSFLASLKSLDLLDIQLLVRLLRLVHAGRIDGTSSDSFAIQTPLSVTPVWALECLSSAITTAVMDEGPSAGAQLVQSCSRDLLAAAVGGVELIQQTGRRRRNKRQQQGRSPYADDSKCDVSVLANPNFEVSRRLVQTLAQSTVKLITSSSKHGGGIVQMMDALAACLFSSKLEAEHRFWALEQLVKVFASTSFVVKRDPPSTPQAKGQ